MKNPTISVLMSVYNGSKYLSTSIDSILNQTYKDFEFIITNDCSNDESFEILKKYEKLDERIKIINNKENKGLTKSLNSMLLAVKGKFIVRMDDDDFAYPNRFEEQVNFMNSNPSILASGTYIRYVGDYSSTRCNYSYLNSDVVADLFCGTPIAHPTAIIRREVFEQYKIFYNESLKYSQDYYFWYEISKVGEIANLPKILLDYRVSSKQISSKHNLEQSNYAINIRKSIITSYVKELDENLEIENILDEFDFATFLKFSKRVQHNKNIRKVNHRQIEKNNDKILYSLFISKKNKGVWDFIEFIYAFIHLRNWKINDYLRVILSFFKPNKYESKL